MGFDEIFGKSMTKKVWGHQRIKSQYLMNPKLKFPIISQIEIYDFKNWYSITPVHLPSSLKVITIGVIQSYFAGDIFFAMYFDPYVCIGTSSFNIRGGNFNIVLCC